MARRKLLAGLAVGAVSATGAALFRRRARNRARVEVYFADGSIVTLDQRSPDAARPLGLARQALSAARGQ
jgi:predicted secreted protein